MKQPDEDALNVMKQAGQDFAQTQIRRWYANEWKVSDPTFKARQIEHWRAVQDRIGEIVGLIKQEMKRAQHEHRTNSDEREVDRCRTR